MRRAMLTDSEHVATASCKRPPPHNHLRQRSHWTLTRPLDGLYSVRGARASTNSGKLENPLGGARHRQRC